MELFKELLSIDSTSGKEKDFAYWCAENLEAPDKQVFTFDDDSIAVLLSWSNNPKLVFCTHLDTVPPYIAPSFTSEAVYGRGSCDAKGQIWAMYRACQALSAKGNKDFALLLLSGEETGSFGAKAWAKTNFTAPFLLVGEPTDNKMVQASKGTKLFDIQFVGSAAHSGYPENGRSAVDMFIDFSAKLKAIEFPIDPILGATTYNFGKVVSDNPHNILSPYLSCRLYFRTTFASDSMVLETMRGFNSDNIIIEEKGGDNPLKYHTINGLETTVVSFGSDAPQLSNFEKKMICGPGSIKFAHTPEEHILISDLTQAINNYIKIYYDNSY